MFKRLIKKDTNKVSAVAEVLSLSEEKNDVIEEKNDVIEGVHPGLASFRTFSDKEYLISPIDINIYSNTCALIKEKFRPQELRNMAIAIIEEMFNDEVSMSYSKNEATDNYDRKFLWVLLTSNKYYIQFRCYDIGHVWEIEILLKEHNIRIVTNEKKIVSKIIDKANNIFFVDAMKEHDRINSLVKEYSKK